MTDIDFDVTPSESDETITAVLYTSRYYLVTPDSRRSALHADFVRISLEMGRERG